VERRSFLKAGAAAGALAASSPVFAQLVATARAPWGRLRAKLGSRLIRVRSPLEQAARRGASGAAELLPRLKNPYFLADEPGLAQSLGWVDAWTFQPSDYAVAAESAADIAAAVDFARTNRIRLAVKGGGHSYFGNSNAPRSLLVWTRRMESIELDDAFLPKGAPADHRPLPAVTVGAGALWGRVYDKVAKAGGYVQGGGCLTVGVAGFTLGGGFGSLSKAFGTGAANLLEAEVVTADGRVRTANAWSEPELFFALRGGGGGSFGIVTRVTMRTHDLPESIGAVLFEVTASSDEAWQALIAHTFAFYRESLFNPVWGEQLRFAPGWKMSVTMLNHGLSEDRMRAVWRPLLEWLQASPANYRFESDPLFLVLPAKRFWDPELLRSLPGIVLTDDRAGAPRSNIYWASNAGEAAQVLHAYQSAWLPARLLDPDRRPALVEAIAAASSRWSITLHTNKGMAGGSSDAIARTVETATNPDVLDAFALVICAAEGPPAWPGIPGFEPDVARARRDAAAVTRAMAPIRRLLPAASAYMSEADFFDPDWKQAYWGRNYTRLAATKRRYDPGGLFQVHHGVEHI
jgi:FAD/FMN-containing dehydrogenase